VARFLLSLFFIAIVSTLIVDFALLTFMIFSTSSRDQLRDSGRDLSDLEEHQNPESTFKEISRGRSA
jgi:hypothetical protein